MEYYSAIKKNAFASVLMRWMKLEPIIQSEVSQKEKHQTPLASRVAQGVSGPSSKCVRLVCEHECVCKCVSSGQSARAQAKRGVAGLLLGRTERAARAAELQLCAQAR